MGGPIQVAALTKTDPSVARLYGPHEGVAGPRGPRSSGTVRRGLRRTAAQVGSRCQASWIDTARIAVGAAISAANSSVGAVNDEGRRTKRLMAAGEMRFAAVDDGREAVPPPIGRAQCP